MAAKDPSAKTKSTPAKKAAPKRAALKAKPAATSTTTAVKTPMKKPRVAKKAAVKKVTAKTTTAKKTAPENVASQKTVSKKAVTKKKPTTKVASKKAVSKTEKIESVSKLAQSLPASLAKASAPAKPAAKKKVAAKKPATKTIAKAAKTPTKTPSLADLQNKIKNLDVRMKRADTRTRNEVKKLGETISTLEMASKKTTTTQKAALTRQVNQLNEKLTSITDDARKMVEAELASALAHPDIDHLEDAVARSEARMAQAETVQDEALKKVNLHLAQLARAVESQLENERKERMAQIAASRAELSGRIDQIETDTSNAFSDMGDKIETLSEALQSKQTDGQLGLAAKLDEVAAQTQADLESYKNSIDARIDHILAKDDAEDSAKFDRLAYQLDRLNARLEQLESDFATLDAKQAELENTPPVYVAPPVNEMQPAMAVGAPSNVVPMPDAFAQAAMPQPMTPAPVPVSMPAPAMPSPASASPTVVTAEPPAPVSQTPREPHEPVEFVPSGFDNTAIAPPAPVSNVREMLSHVTQAELPQNDAAMPPPPPVPGAGIMAPPPMTDAAFTPPNPMMGDPNIVAGDQSAAEMPLPYADPAYAETEMRAERIGGNTVEGGLKSRLANLPISGRNLRLAAMGTVIAAMCVYAGKNLLGASDNRPSNAPMTAQEGVSSQVSNVEMAQSGFPEGNTLDSPVPIGGTEPAIGNYDDNKAPAISAGGATTLNAAAEAGDPIAQFQLGLSYLQEGKTDEGAKLVRQAANKNLPAAQYRLAKLYEAGEGVTADLATARDLTEKAARGGNRIAMHDLALYYTDGRGGVKTDVAKAVGWFEQAANRGVVDSQFNLAVLSESGQGITRNLETALFWYSIAAAQGDQFAQKRVGILREGMSTEQLAALDKRIAGFQPKAINEAANGIFRNVPWATKTDKSVEIERVREVQTLLTDLGYDIGGADGAIGPKTRAAIVAFERANSLPETGEVSPALMQKLLIAAGA